MIALFFTLAFVLVISPILANAASPFKDVKTNHSAYSSIEWAYQQDITKSFANGKFEPDRTVTESQFVDMLIRLDCTAADSFKASTASNYRYLQNQNMPVNGVNNVAARNLPMTKGQAARIAAAFQGVDLSESRAVQYMYKNDMANGANGKNDYKGYGADLSMTRADAVVFLQRLSEKGSCEMIGLNYRPTGSDDKTITLPPNFLGTGTSVTFKPPTVTTQPPVVTQPTVPSVANTLSTQVDVDKPTLIANGVDSTFVTVSLKGCSNGDTIDYSDSLPFTVTSALGAKIDGGQADIKWQYALADAKRQADAADVELKKAQAEVKKAQGDVKKAETQIDNKNKAIVDAEKDLKYWQDLLTNSPADPNFLQKVSKATDVLSTAKTNLNEAQGKLATEREKLDKAQDLEEDAQTLATAANSAYAAALAEVTNRPSSINVVNRTDGRDMIVRVTAPRSNYTRTDTLTFKLDSNHQNTNCASETVTVTLNYVAQAELRLELIASDGRLPANGETALVKATILESGGRVIENYNGSVRFRSTQGVTLSNEYVKFDKGVAWVNITTPNTTYSITDEITAEFDIVDPHYKNMLSAIASTTQRLKVVYEPTLRADTTCSATVPEVAFIIDSSGSMRNADPYHARITKTQEFMKALNAQRNIAAEFNSIGRLLYPNADSVSTVEPTLIKVGQSGGTNISNGLKTAFTAFAPGNAPKVAILLTDGKSNEQQTLNTLAEAKQKNIKIYTIGLGSKKQLNEELLQRIAKETGGHYYHIAEIGELGIAYQSILSAITCDIPAGPACTISSQLFTESAIETVGSDFFMNTYVNDSCGQIARVVLRFNSKDGNIDYELANRGQGYFALQKGTYEINNFHLLQEGVFLAYNANGDLVGEKRVQMR